MAAFCLDFNDWVLSLCNWVDGMQLPAKLLQSVQALALSPLPSAPTVGRCGASLYDTIVK